MLTRTNPRNAGFTLVETAVVFVIAGFLTAGILKAQEIVGQARAKAVVMELVGVQAATIAYYDRYRAWPGDDSNANGRWGPLGAKSGNGDGAIGGKYNDPAPPGDPAATLVIGAGGVGESLNFWWHLRLAGFVVGPLSGPGAASLPIAPAGGVFGVQTGEPAVAGFPAGLVACISDVPERVASTADGQIDDLRPNAGKIRGFLQVPGLNTPLLSTIPVPNTTLPAYLETGTSLYVVCQTIQ